MQDLNLQSLPVVGALDQELTPEGVVYRRNPAWSRPQIVDPLHSVVVTMPAGVRLEFLTDSRCLELDVMLTTLQIAANEPVVPTFDLVVAGKEVRPFPVTDATRVLVAVDLSIDIVPGEPATVRFDLDGDDSIPIEVWFPHAAVMELRAARIDDGASFTPHERRRPRWVHHGSSISHCSEALTPTQTWPALVARSADVDLMNLGLGGSAHLDPHVARTIRDLDVDAISLKIGINIVNGDTMRERVFVPALHGFLDTIRDGHPTTPILVATPILCPVAEDHVGPTLLNEDGGIRVAPRAKELSNGSLTLRRIREIIAEVVELRRAAGDNNLHLVDGLTLFGPEDTDELPDGLHPSAEGYRRIAERFHTLSFAAGGPFAHLTNMPAAAAAG